MPDAVAEVVEADPGIGAEELGRARVQPPVVLGLKREREIPVVKRDPGLDPVLQERVDEVRVEPEPLRVRVAVAGWLDARPRDREPVRLQAHVGHERHVLAESVVMVARPVACVAVLDFARRVREGVPHGRPLPPLAPRPLDLVRRSGGAPHEAVGELGHFKRAGTLRGHRRLDTPPGVLLGGGVARAAITADRTALTSRGRPGEPPELSRGRPTLPRRSWSRPPTRQEPEVEGGGSRAGWGDVQGGAFPEASAACSINQNG